MLKSASAFKGESMRGEVFIPIAGVTMIGSIVFQHVGISGEAVNLRDKGYTSDRVNQYEACRGIGIFGKSKAYSTIQLAEYKAAP